MGCVWSLYKPNDMLVVEVRNKPLLSTANDVALGTDKQ